MQNVNKNKLLKPILSEVVKSNSCELNGMLEYQMYEQLGVTINTLVQVNSGLDNITVSKSN